MTIHNVLWAVCSDLGRLTVPSISPHAERALLAYPCGALIEVLTHAAGRCNNDEIRIEDLDLPEDILLPVTEEDTENEPAPLPPIPTLDLDLLEREAVATALRLTDGNRTRAAGMLGIGLRTLRAKLNSYRAAGIDGAHFGAKQ